MVKGRPEIELDWKRVDDLLACGCPGTEIASWFGIHPETFYNQVVRHKGMSFSEYAAIKRSTGEAILREMQFNKAIGKTKDGDNSLLIWLGKQRLGQKETESEKKVPEDVINAFTGLMQQLDKYQSDRKIDESKSISETKSA